MCSRPQFTKLTYMGGTGPCGPMTIIFGSVIQSQYASLNFQFGVNRTFHVVKTPVYRFDLYGGYQTLQTDDESFWWYFFRVSIQAQILILVCIGRSMCSRPQFTDLTYMRGTGPCGPMTIIFGSVIQSQYASQNINFGVNRTFHVLKTAVYRIDLYGGYRTLWTDDDNFWQCYLDLE